MSGNVSGAPLQGRTLAAFVTVVLVWGSTWLVIRDQIGTVPAAWAVTARFSVAAVAMLALAALRRAPLWPGRVGLGYALAIGVTQFCANFEFVYRAEARLTSGIVACIYALLMVPNAVLGRLVLGTPVTRRFLAGSAVAIAGIALLLVGESRGLAAGNGAQVWGGVGLTVAGLLCASSANILQALPRARAVPIFTLIGWAMLAGAVMDAGFAWATVGPPPLVTAARWWAGVGYLAIIGSVVTFPLYFVLVRELGAGRAAYNGVAVPVVAMTLSTVFEGYRWTGLAVAGSALALGGLVVALSGRRGAAGGR